MHVLDAGVCHLDPSSRSEVFILPVVRKVDCWLLIPSTETVLSEVMLPPQGQLNSMMVDTGISEPSPLASNPGHV